MSTPIGSSQWMYASGAAGFYPYSIDQSLRFNDNDSAYLKRDITTTSNRRQWTWSGWVKRGNLGVGNQTLFTDGKSSNYTTLNFDSDDKLYAQVNSGSSKYKLTTQVFRDTLAFYHFVWAIDTEAVNDADRAKLYVNGQLITDYSTEQYIIINTDTTINLSGNDHVIGGYSSGTSRNFDGMLAEVNFIDGLALDPTSFGEEINNIWVPKQYSGSYGTNGFYLDFSTASYTDNVSDPDVFADQAGSNDFNAYNLAASDIVLDSPTNNFATWNQLDKYNYNAPSEGNLRALTAGNNGTQNSTFAVSSGKWYWEARNGSAGSGSLVRFVGIAKEDTNITSIPYNNSDCYLYYAGNGNKYNGGSQGGYGDTWQADGDIIGVAFDADNGAIWFSKNGTWQNSATASEIAAGTTTNAAFTGLSGTFVMMVSRTGGTSSNDPHHANFGQDSTFAGDETAGGNADANGIGDFKYAPPSGFLALCTSNLPEPTITQSSDYFNIVLYTGDGSASNAITGTNHQPDFLWIKQREVTRGHQLMDSVRGASVRLQSHGGAAEAASALVSFDSDGFTVDGTTLNGTNVDGGTFVAWSWKAGGAASTIAVDTYSSGVPSIASSVSAAPDAGFSIVSWVGTGANATIGHGLNEAPELIIVKNRDVDNNWPVYNKFIGAANRLYLDLTNGSGAASTLWNSTLATNQVFSVGTSTLSNGDTNEMIAYCFHSVDGFSKVGTYLSNNSADGTFVATGFRPSWVMIKRDATTDWQILDTKRNTYNVMNEVLEPNESLSTRTSTSTVDFFADFLSNGFKLRGNGSHANGGTNSLFLYLAFAEAPFKYANAR